MVKGLEEANVPYRQLTMETSYHSKGYFAEFFENHGWTQQSFNATDMAYLPHTVAEQNNFYSNVHIQQNQNVGHWGFSQCSNEAFSPADQFGIQDTYVFHDESVEIAKLELKRERNRIASNKCR